MGISQEKEGRERRIDPRAPIKTSVRITYPTLEKLAEGICTDMSVGGMFVESSSPPEVGASIEFELDLPTNPAKRVEGSGRVVWRRLPQDVADLPPGFGVQFVRLDRRFKELIFRVVDRYIHKGGSPFDLGG